LARSAAETVLPDLAGADPYEGVVEPTGLAEAAAALAGVVEVLDLPAMMFSSNRGSEAYTIFPLYKTDRASGWYRFGS
jgi:hypothetical protein